MRIAPRGLKSLKNISEKEEGVEPFSQSREIVEIDNVPVLEIWPNFKKSDWQVYYTYFTECLIKDTFYAFPYGTHVDDQQRVAASHTVLILTLKRRLQKHLIFQK